MSKLDEEVQMPVRIGRPKKQVQIIEDEFDNIDEEPVMLKPKLPRKSKKQDLIEVIEVKSDITPEKTKKDKKQKEEFVLDFKPKVVIRQKSKPCKEEHEEVVDRFQKLNVTEKPKPKKQLVDEKLVIPKDTETWSCDICDKDVLFKNKTRHELSKAHIAKLSRHKKE